MNIGSYAESLKELNFKAMNLNKEDYPDLRSFRKGTAHLLEHSVFLTQTPEEKSQVISYNAFTASLKTNYMVSVAPENILSALVFKLKQISNLSYYDAKEDAELLSKEEKKDAKVVPTIFNEVTQVDSEYLIGLDKLNW